jgi:uncharacterized protein YggE
MRNEGRMEVRMLKRVVLVALAIALLIPLGLVGFWAWSQVASPVEAQTSEPLSGYSPSQTITVVGQGSVYVQPDVARVSIGVETAAEMVGEAVEQNTEKMQALLAALRDAGIADADIQTMNYSIQFERYPEPMPRATVSESGEVQPQYRVSNMVNVTIRDLDKVGEVLDAAIEAGANNIWGVQFSLEDPEAAQAGARSDAIANATARAEALAELSGVELGPVMSISEVIVGGSVPMAADMIERAAVGAGPISPGELEIGYSVQVTYFIQP